MAKYRAQILLEPNQHQALSGIAAERRQSISHVVREIVQEYLAGVDLDEKQRQEIQAIQALAKLRQSIHAQHGQITVDLLAEARQERDNELADGLES